MSEGLSSTAGITLSFLSTTGNVKERERESMFFRSELLWLAEGLLIGFKLSRMELSILRSTNKA